jgi:DNA-3-methyladenine glycosylase II
MPALIHTEADLAAALAELLALDPRLTALLDSSAPPQLRRRPGGLEGLVRIVMGQQLSVASADAIWGRLRAAYDPFHHQTLLRARTAKLQRVGLSAPNIRTVRAIAQAAADGVIDFDALETMTADEAHAALVAVHGIGPWTADIYLMFCLGHADAWPAGDLALQEAARLGFDLPQRPSAKEMVALAEIWRPLRGVAARVLWAYYRARKRREAVPV